MACTHNFNRTGKDRYVYHWHCSRCAEKKTKTGDDSRPSKSGCSAKGGPEPGQHLWHDEKVLQHEEKCTKCHETRWRT